MVSSISNNSNDDMLQLLMQQMQQKMSSADMDGVSGLSAKELSSIDTSGDEGGAAFIKSLKDQFGELDIDSDGQLSATEISKAKPVSEQQMGPPPGMDLSGSEGEDNSSSNWLNTLLKAAENNSSTVSKNDSDSSKISDFMDKIKDFSEKSGGMAESFIGKLISSYKAGNFSNIVSSVSDMF